MSTDASDTEPVPESAETGTLPKSSGSALELDAQGDTDYPSGGASEAEQKEETSREDSIEIIEFIMAEERYGIELSSVRAVCALKEYSPVPCVPPFVFGIISLRGEIHTVIDLKKLFGLPDAGLTELNTVLIMESAEMKVGFLADEIRGVREIAFAELTPSHPTLTGLRANSLRGVTSDRLMVLDTEKILGREAILVRDEVEA